MKYAIYKTYSQTLQSEAFTYLIQKHIKPPVVNIKNSLFSKNTIKDIQQLIVRLGSSFGYITLKDKKGCIKPPNIPFKFTQQKSTNIRKVYAKITEKCFGIELYHIKHKERRRITIASALTNNVIYWYCGLAAFSLHFIIHLLQFIIWRKYIPAIITTIICIPYCAFAIYKTSCMLTLEELIMYAVTGSSICGANLLISRPLNVIFMPN